MQSICTTKEPKKLPRIVTFEANTEPVNSFFNVLMEAS